jgi:hypothetical protein
MSGTAKHPLWETWCAIQGYLEACEEYSYSEGFDSVADIWQSLENWRQYGERFPELEPKIMPRSVFLLRMSNRVRDIVPNIHLLGSNNASFLQTRSCKRSVGSAFG